MANLDDPAVERQDAPSTTEETAIDKESPSLDLVKRTVNAITTEAQLEQVLEALNAVQFAKRKIREYEERFEESVIFWMKANNVPYFELGGIRYYIGPNRTTKARSNRGVLEAILSAVKGDIDQVAAHLSANAWKYGMARASLGEDCFQELFETKEVDALKEGKPKDKLQAIPKAYLRGDGA